MSPRPAQSNGKPCVHTSSFEFPGGPYGKGFNCNSGLAAAVLDSPALDEGLRVRAGAERGEPLKEEREGPGGWGAGRGSPPFPDETLSLNFPVCETRP